MDVLDTGPRDLRAFRILLLSALVIELLIFAGACAMNEQRFQTVFSFPDTSGYVEIASGLLQRGEIPLNSYRTVGYPLFLLICFFLGGTAHGYYLVLALQLALNLVFLWVGWQLLTRIAGGTRLGVRLVMAVAIFLGGLGLAMKFVTDFQAALCFNLAVYALLFHRSWRWTATGAVFLGIATLTRPTFDLFFLLIPVLVFLVRKFSTRLPWSHAATYGLCTLLAVGISLRCNARAGDVIDGHDRESLLTDNIRILDYVVAQNGDPSSLAGKEKHQWQFHARIADIAGKPYTSLTRHEVDNISVQRLRELLTRYPVQFARSTFKNFFKFLCVPLEQVIREIFLLFDQDDFYMAHLRAVMFLVCLPVWLLCVVPPFGSRAAYWPYYLVTMLLVVYVLGVTSFWSFGGGERMRLPVLPLMLTWGAVNLDALLRAPFLQRRLPA